MSATCSVEGCSRTRMCRGLCPMHYKRLRTRGDIGAAESERPGYGTGRTVTAAGYICLYLPDHPLAIRGRVLEHRAVAWDAYGPFDPAMCVHHVNHDKTDNRPENLVVMTPEEHGKEHRRPPYKVNVDLAVTMYRAGFSTREIAQTFDVRWSYVSAVMRKAGVEVRRERPIDHDARERILVEVAAWFDLARELRGRELAVEAVEAS